MLVFSKAPRWCTPSTKHNFSTIYGDGLVGIRRHWLSGNKMNPVFPALYARVCHPHPLAEPHADSGSVTALAAQEAMPLSVPAGGIDTQLAPAPACRHKVKDAVMAVMLFPHLFTQYACYPPLARHFPAGGKPKRKNDPQKTKLCLKPSKSQRRNHSLCTQIPR